MARIDIEKTLDCNDTPVMRLIKKGEKSANAKHMR